MSEAVEQKSMDELVRLTEEWAIERGLDNSAPEKQFLKVAEEFGEIGSALAKGDEDKFQDSIGDNIVTLIIIALQKGYRVDACLQMAYDEISGRKGETINGVFIKEEDLSKD